MMVRDKRSMKPILLKFGVALAVSFAGLLYFHLRTKRIRSNRSPPSPSASGEGNQFDSGRRSGFGDGLRGLQTSLGPGDDTSVAAGFRQDASQMKVTIDNATVELSPISKQSGDKDGFLLPEFNELLLKEFDSNAFNAGISPHKDSESNTAFKRPVKEETEQEIINLRNMVRALRERETDLEIELLEYYGLKEQETEVMELQNRLKINNMEAKFFILKIESLQADNRRLDTQVADYARVTAELESARAKIKILKRKIRFDADQAKEQLHILQQKVSNLQDQEHKSAMNDPDVQNQLCRLKDLENESEELRRANFRLKLENSELAERLKATQILGASVLEHPEAKALQETNSRLTQENQDLAKEVEQLRADRCTDVEELVYLRWLNACLRHELRNYQPQPGKTVAKDLSKSLSPKSEEKAKKLILKYANTGEVGVRGISLMDFDSDYCSSSQTSNFTDSGDHDDSSGDFSPATNINCSNKTKFLCKLKRLVRGKDNHHSNRDSSVDRAMKSPDAVRRRESVSSASSDSCDMISSHPNPNISETHPASIETRIDRPKKKTTLSQSLSMPSLDIKRLRNPILETIRDVECIWRKSFTDSSQDSQLSHDQDAVQKSELVKYAEVLKGSHESWKPHRKSASYSPVDIATQWRFRHGES